MPTRSDWRGLTRTARFSVEPGQFEELDEYLLPVENFTTLKLVNEFPLAAATDCDQCFYDRLALREQQLATVKRMAAANDLPDAIITEPSLKITPLDAAVPQTAQGLIDQSASWLIASISG